MNKNIWKQIQTAREQKIMCSNKPINIYIYTLYKIIITFGTKYSHEGFP